MKDVERDYTANKKKSADGITRRLALKAGTVAYVPQIRIVQENNTRTGFFESEHLASVLKHLPAPQKTLLHEAWAKREALVKQSRICPCVFSRGGKQIKILDTAWRNARQAAGCPDLVIHDLRRTAIRNLIRAGVTEHVAMMLSGHLTSSVFRRCDIIADSDLVAAAEKLQAASAQ